MNWLRSWSPWHLRRWLLVIAGGQQCTSFTYPPFCRDPRSGRRPDAPYLADRWCEACMVQEALSGESSL